MEYKEYLVTRVEDSSKVLCWLSQQGRARAGREGSSWAGMAEHKCRHSSQTALMPKSWKTRHLLEQSRVYWEPGKQAALPAA